MKTIFLWCREGPSSSAMIRCNLQKSIAVISVCCILSISFLALPLNRCRRHCTGKPQLFQKWRFLRRFVIFFSPFLCLSRAPLFYLGEVEEFFYFSFFYAKLFSLHILASDIMLPIIFNMHSRPGKNRNFEFHKISSAVGLKQQPNNSSATMLSRLENIFMLLKFPTQRDCHTLISADDTI